MWVDCLVLATKNEAARDETFVRRIVNHRMHFAGVTMQQQFASNSSSRRPITEDRVYAACSGHEGDFVTQYLHSTSHVAFELRGEDDIRHGHLSPTKRDPEECRSTDGTKEQNRPQGAITSPIPTSKILQHCPQMLQLHYNLFWHDLIFS